MPLIAKTQEKLYQQNSLHNYIGGTSASLNREYPIDEWEKGINQSEKEKETARLEKLEKQREELEKENTLKFCGFKVKNEEGKKYIIAISSVSGVLGGGLVSLVSGLATQSVAIGAGAFFGGFVVTALVVAGRSFLNRESTQQRVIQEDRQSLSSDNSSV